MKADFRISGKENSRNKNLKVQLHRVPLEVGGKQVFDGSIEGMNMLAELLPGLVSWSADRSRGARGLSTTSAEHKTPARPGRA
jgi:hypothetical protein